MFYWSQAALEAAHTAELILAHGRTVGLTEEETREVVGVWSEYFRVRPEPMDWDVVRRAITARSIDEEWTPEGLQRSLGERISRLFVDRDCLLCGRKLESHDDEACEAKLKNWKPTGILSLLKSGENGPKIVENGPLNPDT